MWTLPLLAKVTQKYRARGDGMQSAWHVTATPPANRSHRLTVCFRSAAQIPPLSSCQKPARLVWFAHLRGTDRTHLKYRRFTANGIQTLTLSTLAHCTSIMCHPHVLYQRWWFAEVRPPRVENPSLSCECRTLVLPPACASNEITCRSKQISRRCHRKEVRVICHLFGFLEGLSFFFFFFFSF